MIVWVIDGRVLGKLTQKLVHIIDDQELLELTPFLESTSTDKAFLIQKANKIIAIAEEKLHVPAIIVGEDLVNGRVDEKSMMLYVSMFKTEYDAYLERKVLFSLI